MTHKFYRFHGVYGQLYLLEGDEICGYAIYLDRSESWIYTKFGRDFWVKEIPPEVMKEVFGEGT